MRTLGVGYAVRLRRWLLIVMHGTTLMVSLADSQQGKWRLKQVNGASNVTSG
jgi:hypothetical protein